MPQLGNIVNSFKGTFVPPDNFSDGRVMEPHDAGWRKYFLVLVCVGLMTYGLFWSGDAAISKEILERRSISLATYSDFLLFALGLYFGANVGYKWAAGTTNAKAAAANPPTQTPPTPAKSPSSSAPVP